MIEAAIAALAAHSPQPPAEVRQAQVLDQSSVDIVAACLVGEAGGEKDAKRGMQAVMNVIANRAGGDRSKFVAVCLKRKQFSMFNRATGKRPRTTVAKVTDQYRKHPLWATAQQLVKRAAVGSLEDITGQAKFYHEVSINPDWARPDRKTVDIGNHRFYRESLADTLLRRLL